VSEIVRKSGTSGGLHQEYLTHFFDVPQFLANMDVCSQLPDQKSSRTFLQKK
jgi:hypothetical protein